MLNSWPLYSLRVSGHKQSSWGEVAMAMCSCSGRMGLQGVLRRASTCSSSSFLLLAHARRLRSRAEFVYDLALVILPRPFTFATVFPNSSRSFSSTPTVRCNAMPREVESPADIKTDESSERTTARRSRCCTMVNMLRERSKSYGDGIKFVDICAEENSNIDYALEENSNIDFETVKLLSLLICHQQWIVSTRYGKTGKSEQILGLSEHCMKRLGLDGCMRSPTVSWKTTLGGGA